MKVIIAGSRTISGEAGERMVRAALWMVEALGWKVAEVVCGEARGIDSCGRKVARECGIAVASFPADWTQYGREAGFRRNVEMAKYADALIAITNGSPGTRHMIQTARGLGLPVLVIEVPSSPQQPMNLQLAFNNEGAKR